MLNPTADGQSPGRALRGTSSRHSRVKNVGGRRSWRDPYALIFGLAVGVAFLLMHVSLYLSPLLLVVVLIATIKRGVDWTIMMPFAGGLLAILALEVITTPQNSFNYSTVVLSAVIGSSSMVSAIMAGVMFRKSMPTVFMTIIAVIVIANIFAYIVGITPTSSYFRASVNSTLSLFGVFTNRVQFYFAQGVNAYGTACGYFLVVSVIYYLEKRSSFAFLVLALVVIELLLTDSRGAMVFAILTLLLVYLLSFRRLFVGIIVFSVVLPVILIAFDATISHALAEFARVGATDYSTGRVGYWTSIIHGLEAREGAWIFGVGLTGANALGERIQTLAVFANFVAESNELPNAHNLWIQVLLEGGTLKVLLVVAILIYALPTRRVSMEMPMMHRRLSMSVIYIPLAGVLEATFGYLRYEMLFLALFILGASISARYSIRAGGVAKSRMSRRKNTLARAA